MIAARLPLSSSEGASPLWSSADETLERRRQYLAVLRGIVEPSFTSGGTRINVRGDKTWDEWVNRSGELPPDFLTMPSNPFLPDPLVMLDSKSGRRITTAADWEKQRGVIRQRMEHWVLGSIPPTPTNMRSFVTGTSVEGDVTVRRVRLEFGPDHKAILHLQLLIPNGPGPFPVFVTNHQRGRPWVNTAARRGYMGCIYSALDPYYGPPDDTEKWLDVYPDYDFSVVTRWGWAASRAVDHLVTLPEVDRARIAIGGHSRNSKQALVAAAIDKRIGAAVLSRGNTGDFMPWRFTDDYYFSESIEVMTANPDWFHPRLRFFVGREDKLPIDQNLMLSLVAPRGLLISHASMEHHGNAVGAEQSYRSVKRVYQFLGHEDNVGLYQQPGEHPSSVEDVERYFDFFDTVFNRARHPRIEIWVHGYSYADWLKQSGERISPLAHPRRSTGDFLNLAGGEKISASAWPARRKEIQSKITWTMGVEPPFVPFPTDPGADRIMVDPGWRGQMYNRPGAYYEAGKFPFGDDLEGFVYRPSKVDKDDKNPNTNWPVVIWLHPYSYATGYSRYVYWGPLMDRGFAIVTFDQIGFGVRNDYTLRFHERYPNWSLMGKMIADTRAAVDSLVRNAGRYDPSRIYLQGYGLGAKVALLAAALDDRVAGVSALSGFTPLRLDRPEKGTEGIRHYSHIHGLLPRLGAFIGNESRVPVDYDEIIAAIAPRPVQILAPTMDRHAPVEDVKLAVEAARGAYRLLGKPDALDLVTPADFNRYKSWMQQIDWITTKAGIPIPPPPPPKVKK